VLEVQSDGHGGFLVDELVFSNAGPIDLAGANIEFSFLGLTDPSAFEASGLWILDTFFKINPNAGGVFNPSADVGISAILGPGETLDDFFANATFEATAELYARHSLAAAHRVRESIQDGVASGAFRAVNADFVGAAVSLLIDGIQHGELLDRSGLSMADAYTELGALVLAALTNPGEK